LVFGGGGLAEFAAKRLTKWSQGAKEPLFFISDDAQNNETARSIRFGPLCILSR
jgi:hypothetical protein